MNKAEEKKYETKLAQYLAYIVLSGPLILSVIFIAIGIKSDLVIGSALFFVAWCLMIYQVFAYGVVDLLVRTYQGKPK